MTGKDEARKGLRLTVYRGDDMGDCTNGGITAAARRVTVTGVRRGASREAFKAAPLPREMQVFPPCDDAPEVTLVIREHGDWLHLEPVTDVPAGRVGYMDGGNYAGTTDSRWTQLTGGGSPVAVHDRTERG